MKRLENPRFEFDLLLAEMENFLCQIVHCLSRLRPLAFDEKSIFLECFFFLLRLCSSDPNN